MSGPRCGRRTCFGGAAPQARPLVAVAFAVIAAVGCAGWDGLIDPRFEPIGPREGALPAAAARAGGDVERRLVVRDVRAFRTGLGSSWEHTLYEGDASDREATARVVARRRAVSQQRLDMTPRLGNVRLPEGRTVAGLVAEALAAGFGDAGFTLRDDAVETAEGEGVPVVEAEVVGFWGRSRPNNRVLRIETWLRVRVHAPGTALGPATLVCAQAMVATPSETGAAWRRSIENALVDLERRTAAALRDGPPAYCIRP